MITAPFNFVPLSDKVFFPDWAEDISHDIPFEDGERGVIDITITAKSPIFIRDGEDDTKFCNFNGEYYIPSSSIKGMVRNVLEIMSFSKMSKNSLDDNTYAVRDLSKADNFYMSQMKPDNTFCGWLKKEEDGNYIIEDCGIPGRISHQAIDKALGINFSSNFNLDNFDAKNQEQKSSEYKYSFVKDKDLNIKVDGPHKSKTNAKYDKREFYRFDLDTKKIGKLVLTGQPTARKNSGKQGDGKGFEFLFFDVKSNLKVDKEIFENFKFAYFDGRVTQPKESPDWAYWKKKLNCGEKVPVFFQKLGNKVSHFGLSYLYKLPYKHSTVDGVSEIHFDKRLDLAQSIFGHIENDNALKGRVQFSHFKAINKTEPLKSRTEILGTPRASYYPMYVKQNGKSFITFMDDNFSIAGRKRYPIHSGKNTKTIEKNENQNVGTQFEPLKEGTIFSGKLRYHNLKKVELGALLSALTFHNTPNTYHNIGMAKSLGYGKIILNLESINDIDKYLKAFETQITIQIDNWIDSEQLKELLTMSTEQNNSNNSKLEYISLQSFAKYKTDKNRDYLRSYTELENIKTITPKSFMNKEDLELLKMEQVEQKKADLQRKEDEQKALVLQKEKEKEERAFNDALSSDNKQKLQNFIAKYPDYDGVEQIKQKVEKIISDEKINRHQEVDKKAKHAWEQIKKKKSNPKAYKKDKEKFIEKWSKGKNNKGSEFILELVQKAKEV